MLQKRCSAAAGPSARARARDYCATRPGTISTTDGVNCNAQTNEVEAMKDLRLSQINAEFDHVFSVSDWANLLDIPASTLTVSKGERRPFGDAYYQIATLGMKADDNTPMKARFGVYVLPGRVTMAGCYAPTSSFASWEATFEQTVSSLRPW